MDRYIITKQLKQQEKDFTILPQVWNKNILMKNGKVDSNAILLLTWLMDVYRKGEFDGDQYCVDYKTITEETNLTKEQAKKAISRLVASKLIKQELDRYAYDLENNKFVTDMWLIPNTKKIRHISSGVRTQTKKRKHKGKPQRTEWQQRVLAAKNASEQQLLIAVDKNTVCELNDERIRVGSLLISKERYRRLKERYGKAIDTFPIGNAIVNSLPGRKIHVSGYAPNKDFRDTDFVRELFSLLWSFCPRKNEHRYEEQLGYSLEVLAPIAEFADVKGATPRQIFDCLTDNKVELERSYKTRLGNSGKSVHKAKYINDWFVSIWLKEFAPVFVSRLNCMFNIDFFADDFERFIIERGDQKEAELFGVANG